MHEVVQGGGRYIRSRLRTSRRYPTYTKRILLMPAGRTAVANSLVTRYEPDGGKEDRPILT
jgi:hypothetical protein